MKIVVFVFTIVLFILALSINISISAEYDFVKNIGRLKVKLFKVVPIYLATISLSAGYIKLIKKKHVKQLKIDLQDKKFLYLKEASKTIKTKRYLTLMELDYLLGLTRPDICAQVNGYIKSLIGAYFAYIKAREVDTDLISNGYISFTENEAFVYFSFEFLITLFDTLWALVMALHRTRSNYGSKKQAK